MTNAWTATLFIVAVGLVAPAGGRAEAQPVASPSSSDSAASPEPVPDWQYGTTPAAGCPRFFIGLTLPRIDACADRLAAWGWGLSAVAYRGRGDGPDFVDLLAGAFEPHSPPRRLQRDDDPAPHDSEALVNVVEAYGHLVLIYQRGKAHDCEDLVLYYPHDFHVDDERRYFTAKMSERAAAGCVPGSYYSLIRAEAIQQEVPDEHIAFVPGDPRTTAAFWPRNAAERKAFEKRAAARGFQRLSLDDVPDRWGKTAGKRYAQEIRLGTAPARYEVLEGPLRAAAQRGERMVDLRLVTDDQVPTAVRILWELPPERTLRHLHRSD